MSTSSLWPPQLPQVLKVVGNFCVLVKFVTLTVVDAAFKISGVSGVEITQSDNASVVVDTSVKTCCCCLSNLPVKRLIGPL